MFWGVATYFLIRLKLLPKTELTAGTVNRKKIKKLKLAYL